MPSAPHSSCTLVRQVGAGKLVDPTCVVVMNVVPWDPTTGVPFQVQTVLHDDEGALATRADGIPVSLKLVCVRVRARGRACECVGLRGGAQFRLQNLRKCFGSCDLS